MIRGEGQQIQAGRQLSSAIVFAHLSFGRHRLILGHDMVVFA
jgi:hypothetical protein